MSLSDIKLDIHQQMELEKRLNDWKKTVTEQLSGVKVEENVIYLNGEIIGNLNDDPHVLGENLIAVLAKRELTNIL